MANGHYDHELGMCYQDEIEACQSDDSPDAGSGFPYMDKPDNVPDECWSDTLGTDWDCMNRDTVSNLLEDIWDYLFGESD